MKPGAKMFHHKKRLLYIDFSVKIGYYYFV